MNATLNGASAEAIRHHYDAGNEFYRLWLDPTMTYTCALYEDGDGLEEDILAAQIRKMDYHIARSGAAGGRDVLDIGCGWGGMLRRLVSHHGVARATGLTLSNAQANWILNEPDPRLEVRLENWEEHEPVRPYDAILSIEAMEAFVRPGLSPEDKVAAYRRFFECCHAWLRSGGKMSLQIIAYGNSCPEDLNPFISREIFPESDLPRLAELAAAVERRFEITSLVNHRKHYVRTLRAWLRRLHGSRREAVRRMGEETVRRYEHYLQLSIIAFASGSCDLFRVALARIDRPRMASQASYRKPGATGPKTSIHRQRRAKFAGA